MEDGAVGVVEFIPPWEDLQSPKPGRHFSAAQWSGPLPQKWYSLQQDPNDDPAQVYPVLPAQVPSGEGLPLVS
jgi:hypothetical protein